MDENKIKIGFLILATSKNRDNWKSIKDSYLYNISLKSSLLTINREHKYVYYIGIDENDRIFDKKEEQEEILKFQNVFKHITIKFIVYDNKKIPKGHHTLMWNLLFENAYNDGCDYFYQCGDDIEFKTNNWINDSINMLKSKNNIGLTGPINNNNRILTQSFVSRKHMEIFGWYFPVEIKNWCCDDWYNMVYHPNYLYPLKNHYAENKGGAPRYKINNDDNFALNNMIFKKKLEQLRKDTEILANKHKKLIENYLNIK